MPFGLKLRRTRRYNVLSKNCFVTRIRLLDSNVIECTLSVESTGQECLEAVAQRLELREVRACVLEGGGSEPELTEGIGPLPLAPARLSSPSPGCRRILLSVAWARSHSFLHQEACPGACCDKQGPRPELAGGGDFPFVPTGEEGFGGSVSSHCLSFKPSGGSLAVWHASCTSGRNRPRRGQMRLLVVFVCFYIFLFKEGAKLEKHLKGA